MKLTNFPDIKCFLTIQKNCQHYNVFQLQEPTFKVK